MKFNVEILFNNKIFRHSFFADDLEDLQRKINKQFPKGKVVSILGG